ncbi:MAG TPA: maleylacetoacetate isomerase [Acetobacteraceae bacterium]|nr:maleylacetoacetate isomerase [Acetobacteraceae bacterium]
MKLYEYFRSSATYRVRIALNLKKIAVEMVPIHLLRNGGEQDAPSYRAINPQGRVPALVLDDGTTLIQSPAILEWLEETYPDPPLLPRDPIARAHVRGIAALIACDIHPLNNLSVLTYLRNNFNVAQDKVDVWYRHWITTGFTALEQMLSAPYCCGDGVTLADVMLVPQVANARRFGTDLTPFPRITAIEQTCLALPAFDAARPEVQPGAA